MNPRDLSQRQLYKFSGPPENWITAIKYMTWGLTDNFLERWKQIEPGDIFLMHSMSTNTIVKGAPSAVVGFGVVGPDFRVKNSLLWLEEILESKNKWSLLVPFSEIYLFSDIRSEETLQAPDGKNSNLVVDEVKELLSTAPSLPAGFPQMGSFSSVRPEVVMRIFTEAGNFYLYNSRDSIAAKFVSQKPLRKIDSPSQLFRKPITLSNLDVVKKKTLKKGQITFAKDLDYNEKAESAHFETLSFLVDLLKSQGYQTYDNQHVDLFAVRDDASYLFEVKSFNQKNFRSQSRKGIAQLFEYEYFEIRKFMNDNQLRATTQKSLIYSQKPDDSRYLEFINHLKMETGYFSSRKFIATENSNSLSSLVA